MRQPRAPTIPGARSTHGVRVARTGTTRAPGEAQTRGSSQHSRTKGATAATTPTTSPGATRTSAR
eukprot:10237997-Alexandrium_andersonii.AAC.1